MWHCSDKQSTKSFRVGFLKLLNSFSELLALFFVPSYAGQEKLDPDAYFISDLDALKYIYLSVEG